MIPFPCACLLALHLVAQTPSSQTPPLKAPRPTEIQNPSFADGKLGELPPGWRLAKSSLESGYTCQLAEDTKLKGKRCAVISQKGTAQAVGNLMQSLDAKPYRGKRIRLRAQLRVEGKSASRSKAQMWVRVDRPNQQMGFFDNMADRPVTESSWKTVEIIGDVTNDAEGIALGVMHFGEKSSAWVAPLSLEVLGNAPAAQEEGPRALTSQGLQNLQAFSKAMNYIRFFHPSDEASRADWSRLAAQGVRAVESAPSASELATTLQTFFAPYAPSARFMTKDQSAPVPVQPSNAAFLVRWKHTGFGQNDPQSPYHSTREYLPLAKGATQKWPTPQQTSVFALGSGVSLYMPSVLYADKNKATLPAAAPRSVSAPKSTELPEPTAGFGSGNVRGTRLGNIALAWGVFQHFYPYFEVVKTDWETELIKGLKAAAEDADANAFAHTLRHMVAALKDGHGHVRGGLQYHASPSLGLALLDGKPVVQFSGESAKAIPLGSLVLEIDGERVETRLSKLSEEISAAADGWMKAQLQRQLLAGLQGTPVKVSYRTPSGQHGEVSLSRDANIWELERQKPQKLSEIKPGIWYVDLDRVSDEDFKAALPKLAKAQGVIFDLRGYPMGSPLFLQHLTDKPLESAQWNVPIVTQPDQKGWEWNTGGRWNLKPQKPRIKGKVAFLTGGGAISYAESCMGIVEAYKLAEIVGEPTAGTNGNVNPIKLPGGYSISWTGMKVLKHDGSQHHGIGIHPTVPVKPTQKGLAEGRDEVLEMGIKVVSPSA